MLLLLLLSLVSCLELIGGPGPNIEDFKAEPTMVAAGGTVRLSWRVDGLGSGRLTLQATEEGSSSKLLGDVTGQKSIALEAHRSTTYRLVASAPTGYSSRSARVTVIGDGGSPDRILLVVAGQSNASGYGLEEGGQFPTDATEAPADGVMMLTEDREWVRASEPIHENGKHSFGVRMAKEIRNATSAEVYLVPAAVSGSQLSQWNPGATYFEEAVSRAEFASESLGVPVSAVVWFQGESETKYKETRRDFSKNTEAVFQGFRDRMPGTPEVIFVQLSKRLFHGTQPNNNIEGHNLAYQEIREQQRQMEGGAVQLEVGSDGPPESSVGRPYYHLVVSHDLSMSDIKHVSAPGQRELGFRVANTFLASIWEGPMQGAYSVGPRLERVLLSDDRRAILVDTDMELNESSHYDGYFTVFVDGVEQQPRSIGRDVDTTRVRLEFAAPLSGEVEIRYMPPDDTALYAESSQAVHATVGGIELPLPAFGGPVEELEDFYPGLREAED
jgi:hypothetical protein